MKLNIFRFKLFLLLFYCLPSIAFPQNSTCFWCSKGGSSLKFFTSISYQEGKGEMGFGIPLGIGYQKQYCNGRIRVHTTLQDGNFMNFGITDVPDYYYRVTTLGLFSDIDVLRYYSFSIVLSTGVGGSLSRGIRSEFWDMDGNYSSGGYFARFYPTVYLAYGIRIAPRKSKYALEIFLPPGGHANSNFYLIHAIRVGVDYKF